MRATTTAPAPRRDAVDVARALALLVVVLGHLLLAVIDRPHGHVRGANLLALHPAWAFLAAFAPMPVFFAAAGWANATSTLATSARRLRTLVGLGAVVVCAWSAAVVVARLVAGDPGVLADGARIATQPLWFVAAYVPLAAAGGPLARLARRHVVATVGGALAVLAVMDTVRFGLGGPRWVGWPGFYLAWATPWLVGAWWRSRYEAGGLDERRAGGDERRTGDERRAGLDERRTGLLLALGAGGACVLLATLAGYSPALIDAVPGARSNTTPPTLYTATAALAQCGLLIAGAGALDRAGRRWRSLWDRAGEAAVGVYVWHLTALALCAALVTAGVPVPDRLTVAWWLTRPLWWAAILTVTLGFVLATAAARARLRGRRRTAAEPPVARVVAATVLAAAGGVAVGLKGPRTAGLATLCSVLFLAAWLLLRPRRAT